MYCFSLEFRLKSVGSASVNFLVSSKVGYNDIRSINCEVYLQPGTYEVLPRVTASDRPWGQPVEQVVKEQARFNPVKLRQVGLRYDLAHAKAGVLDEDETQKTKRQKKRAKQKARAKDAQTNPNGYLEQVVQQIVTTVQEEVKKLIIGDNKDVKGDDKERDEKSSQRKQVSHEFTKSHPGCSSVASIVDTKDKPVREIEPGSSMERTASMTEENTRSTIGPEKPVKGTVPEPEPSPPPPLVLYNNTPIPVGNGGLKSDSDSDPDSDRWSDSDSDTDIVQAEQRWNPVCVMCLRVYAHDKEVSIKLVEEDDAAAGNGVAPVVEANA